MKEFPNEKMTMGQAYGPAMKITDEQEAREYFEVLVQYSMRRFGQSREEAEKNERESLGFWAGYYDDATRERVERLFSCAHPVFGPIAKGKPTPEEAFRAGQEWAVKEGAR